MQQLHTDEPGQSLSKTLSQSSQKCPSEFLPGLVITKLAILKTRLVGFQFTFPIDSSLASAIMKENGRNLGFRYSVMNVENQTIKPLAS